MHTKSTTWLQNTIIEDNNNYIVIFLAMLYVTIKLACSLMYLRPVGISLFGISNIENIPSASFLYPIIYIINLNILMLSNKRISILVALIGILCDGIFSFGSHYSTSLIIPHTMTQSELQNTVSVNTIAGYMWSFYVNGILISIIASIASLELFLFFNKMNLKLPLNLILSTYIPVITHHMIRFIKNADFIAILHNFIVFSIIYISVLTIYSMATITIRQITTNNS